MRIFVPIPNRMSHPMISEWDPTFFPNFFQNSTQIYDRANVKIQITIAGKNIEGVVAVKEIPIARASILVAIPRTIRE